MVPLFPEIWFIVAAFFFFGVFVAILGLISLFFSSHSGLFRATEFPQVCSKEFLRTLSHITDYSSGRGGKITVLQTGEDFLRALMEEIRQAKKSINITAYVWEAGKVTDQITGILSDKSKKGVSVRLLLDGIGGWSATKKQLEKLKHDGVDVRYFRGIRPGKLMRLHRRTHRRAMIFDGRVAFTGGMAFSDFWYEWTKRGGHAWRDLMFRMTGAPALALQTSFSELWVNSAGEVLSGDRFYPRAEDAVKEDLEHDAYPKHNGDNRPFFHLSSSPSSDIHPYSRFLWLSAVSAKKRLYISTAYFVPNRSFHDALKERARAGVDVRIILPCAGNIDKPFVRWAANSYYWDLLDAGVRIFEYQPAMIHTKLFIADDCWSVFGSANIDFRSFELNEENVFGVQDRVLATHLTGIFEEDLKHSKEIFLEEWKKRGIIAKIREKTVLLFAEQF